MATKKIKLVAFTVLATVGVLANDFSHIAAPTLTAAQGARITDQEIRLARGETAKTVYLPTAAPPMVPAAAQPRNADTTVTYVESDIPVAEEEPVEVVGEEPIAAPAPPPTETVKEVEIAGYRYVSDTIDSIATGAVNSTSAGIAIAPAAEIRSRFNASIAAQASIPVKAKSPFLGQMYLSARTVDRPKLAPIFLTVEQTLSQNPNSLATQVTGRKIAGFSVEKPKTIVETLVIPRPDVFGNDSLAVRKLAAPQQAPKAPRPVFNIETAIAANFDQIGPLSVSMRQVNEPLRNYPLSARSQTIEANADHLDVASISARTIERAIVQLPNWFANSTLVSNRDAVSTAPLASRTVAPFLIERPVMFAERPVVQNANALDHAIGMRNVSPMPMPIATFAASPVFANAPFVGDLRVSAKTFNAAAPAKPEVSAVAEMVNSRTDFLGSLALQARSIAPRPAAPILNAALAASASPVKQMAVLIDNKVAFGRSMLAPMPLRPDALIADVEPLSRKGGPTATIPITSDKPMPIANSSKSLPVLIGSKPEFSANLLKPMKPVVVVSNPLSLPVSSAKTDPQQQQGYCDPNFVGEPIRFSQTVELRLEDLLNQLHSRFGVNFIAGPNVGKFPINVKAGSIPWNVLLRSQLFISGVRARCIDANTIELVENSLLPNLQDSAGVETKFVKLKFLQRTGGGTVDLANRSQGGQNGGQGGCGGGGIGGGGGGGGEIAGGGGGGGGGQSGQTAATQGSSRFDQLVQEIEKILGLRSMTAGNSGGTIEGEERRTDRFVTQIPGRNILAVRATEDEHQLIAQIIERADRPPFQVVIKGLVYSANQDRIRDVGVNITGSSIGGRNAGGIFGDTLGVGTLFDFSTIIGTFDFNVQATAFQQNGVISVKSRPFATVLDGLCTTLSVGTKLPIVIDGSLGVGGGITILNADNLLAVTPYVVDDENGNPIAVTLDLNLQANVIDSSITARGVPAVNSKNIQTQLLLGPDKTAILGGFSIDQDSKTISKVPGLGSIPIIGELFKRRIQDQRLSRLYFAISAEVIPFPKAIEPVKVPGATTDPQTITEEMKKRAEAGEQKPVDANAPYKKKDN